jgi:alkylation response protein AidB-like acyl-CoA dehydrogenase
MTQDLLSEAFRQMLEAHCTPRRVRDIESGAPADALWRAIEESGFANALLPEVDGGAGLRLRDVFPIILLSGAYALPLPLAHTMVLRAALAAAGRKPPDGSITIACVAERSDNGAIRCEAVPFGAVADWVVLGLGDASLLLDTRQAKRIPTGVHNSLEADLVWADDGTPEARFTSRTDWQAIGAAVHAAQMAGAMERVLQRTVDYAGERSQFGKAIGKFQAIQQQLSIMAEEVFASRMAAEIGCASASYAPDRTLAAVAKSRVSEAAWTVASIAHAVHGAIGITEEYDLQLQTRSLHEWRLSYGSESFWNDELGRALLAGSRASILEFVREDIFVWEDETGEGSARLAHVQ